jgi:chromosome segregation ATPase
MRNFMTYDFVEFRPGPHLNMIIGPNGTGKSTIAASIAIGLGFPPKVSCVDQTDRGSADGMQVMGRSNDLKAYVKQGSEEAMVEVEIKGKPKQRNSVIRRSFTRESDKSDWHINCK